MPRTGKHPSRLIIPDPLYQSLEVTKLINRVMKHGKKSLAQQQVYRAFQLLKEKTGQEPLTVFEAALRNVTPKMMVRSRRVGGATYQVPMPVKGIRGLSLSVRWLILEAQKRPSKQYHTFAQRLAAELIDAAEGAGGAVQRKLTAHRQAEANKAFAHFRW